MKQTEKYKFNLIETSDTFSPAPLNENAENTETQLAALEGVDAAAATAINALNADVHPGAPGQIARIATGYYTGKYTIERNGVTTLQFDFIPMLIFVFSTKPGNTDTSLILMRSSLRTYMGLSTPCDVTWGERSVTWSNYYPTQQCDSKDVPYCYIAVGIPA